jgi:hypothetical protein
LGILGRHESLDELIGQLRVGHLWEVDLAEKETNELWEVQAKLRSFVVVAEGH